MSRSSAASSSGRSTSWSVPMNRRASGRRPLDDRLDRLAGQVAAEDEDVRPVDGAGVEELPEALLDPWRSVAKKRRRAVGHRPSGRGRARACGARVHQARARRVDLVPGVPSTLRLVPTIAPSATAKISPPLRPDARVGDDRRVGDGLLGGGRSLISNGDAGRRTADQDRVDAEEGGARGPGRRRSARRWRWRTRA